MVGWHHRLDGHEFAQALGDGEGQGSLVCCSPWGPKPLDTNEQLNKNNEPLEPAASFFRASGPSRVDWTPFWRLTSYLNPHVLSYLGSPELLFWTFTKR